MKVVKLGSCSYLRSLQQGNMCQQETCEPQMQRLHHKLEVYCDRIGKRLRVPMLSQRLRQEHQPEILTIKKLIISNIACPPRVRSCMFKCSMLIQNQRRAVG